MFEHYLLKLKKKKKRSINYSIKSKLSLGYKNIQIVWLILNAYF